MVAVAVALIGATTAALAADAASSDGWTAARQVALSVTGRDTCGIADDVQIPDARSVERLEPWPRPVTVRADQRTIASTTGSRWYQVPDERVGTFIRGDWNNQRLVVSWGRRDGERVRVIVSRAADLRHTQTGAIGPSWWFVSETSFPERPPDADVVRTSVVTESSMSPGEVSQPFSYETRELGAMVDVSRLKTLSSPYLFEALPCATLPRLELGVAEPPNLLLDGGPPPLTIDDEPLPRGHRHVHRLEGAGGVGVGWVFVSVGEGTAYWVVRDPRDAIAPVTRRQVT